MNLTKQVILTRQLLNIAVYTYGFN